jgi:integrase
MRLKKYQINNKSFFSIVDDLECPIDPYISNYINSALNRYSPNTKEKYLYDLIFSLRFFYKKGINLVERVKVASFITHKEYYDFYEASHLKSKEIILSEIKTKHNKQLKAYAYTSLEDKVIRDAIEVNSLIKSKVHNDSTQGRIRQLRKFLNWLFNEFHSDNNVPEKIEDNFNKLICKIQLDESSFSTNHNNRIKDINESVIDTEKFKKLIDIIRPTSSENPFQASKFRNYLIILILIQTGARKGAIAKLKISDCHFYGSFDQLSIYRSPEDDSDTRLHKPNQKTKAHTSVISRILMTELKYYIDNIRKNFRESESHDFVFISEKNSKGTSGQPLSVRSFNSITKKLSEIIGTKFSPHTLRYKWNELFSDEVEEKGIEHDKSEDIRKSAMGWVQNTEMTEVYNQNRLAKKAREISLKLQDRINSLNE